MVNKKHQRMMSLWLSFIMVFSIFTGYMPVVTAQTTNDLASPVVHEDNSVSFNFEGDADRVRVAGSFTDWQDNAIDLVKNVGVWSVTIDPLTPAVYGYKFILDDSNWINDPLNEAFLGNDSRLVVEGLNLQAIQSLINVDSTRELVAELINKDGSSVAAENVVWSLDSEPTGVEVNDSTLVVADTAPVGATFTLIAEKDEFVSTKQIELIGSLYEYTINYHRLNNNFTDWDMWIFDSGYDPQGYEFQTTYGEEFVFATGTHSFPENDITIIPRKTDWSDRHSNDAITVAIPDGQDNVEVWLVQGHQEVFTSEAAAIAAITGEEFVEPIDRHIRFVYEREDADYDGWNIWVWGTGVQDGQIDFTEIKNDKAYAKIDVSPNADRVGFVLRSTDDWDTAVKDVDPDRFINVNSNDPITKVHVMSGEIQFLTVPEVTGPVIEEGNVHFYYRDPLLYLEDAMSEIEKVELSIFGERFEMTYEEANERFSFTYENIEHGTHEYTFFVTIDGVETEVTDPYNTINGVSVISYIAAEIGIKGSVFPETVNYNQNAVVTIELEKEEGVEVRELYIDTTAVGGPERLHVDRELNEITIAIDRSTTAGLKTLPITAVDQYGNRHVGEAIVEVAARNFIGEADFDWDEALIYFLLTDRFFDGDPTNNDPYGIGYDTSQPGAYQGGDFKGITKKLDYLYDLGINTIWINPIVENIMYDVSWNPNDPDSVPYYAYHGYWASNFEELNPHFGTIEDFHELIDEAHDRGMKIMIDVVLNHTGYGLKESDAHLYGEVPFFPSDEDRARFEGMLRDGGDGSDLRGELAGLPDFITEDPAVRDQVVQWQVDWIEKSRTANGNTIDYFRVDTVKHVEDTTWMAFKNELTKVMPEFKMIGESWGAGHHDDHGYLNTGTMDSLLDFEFKNYARNFVNGQIDQVNSVLTARNDNLTNGATLGQFLGSHDEPGFLHQLGDNGDLGKLKIAAALQITAKGQPVIYYGEELGLSGLDNWPYYDNRPNMPWDQVEGNEVLAHYTKLLNIRKDNPQVFARGTREEVAGGNAEGYSVFARSYNGETMIVGLNTTNEEQQTTFEVPFENGAVVVDLYSGATFEVANNEVTVQLASRDNGGTFVLALADADEEQNETPTTPEQPSEGSTEPGVGEENATEENDGVSENVTENADVVEENTTTEEGAETVGEETTSDKATKGESLPNTATTLYNWLLIGSMIVLAAGALYFFQRRKRVEE